MKNKLSGLQNILWAIGILAVGLALLVGLVVSMSARYEGERLSGTMTLGEGVQREKRGGAASELDAGPTDELMALPEVKKVALDEVLTTTFLCDKTLLGLRSYIETYGDGATASIWTDNGSGFYAAKGADSQIVFVDGSLVTPGNAAMITRPRKVVLYLGGDGLADTTEQDFINGYVGLVNSIREASPNTILICCSIASISSNYLDPAGLHPDGRVVRGHRLPAQRQQRLSVRRLPHARRAQHRDRRHRHRGRLLPLPRRQLTVAFPHRPLLADGVFLRQTCAGSLRPCRCNFKNLV